jgi:hypothetical protein
MAGLSARCGRGGAVIDAMRSWTWRGHRRDVVGAKQARTRIVGNTRSVFALASPLRHRDRPGIVAGCRVGIDAHRPGIVAGCRVGIDAPPPSRRQRGGVPCGHRRTLPSHWHRGGSLTRSPPAPRAGTSPPRPPGWARAAPRVPARHAGPLRHSAHPRGLAVHAAPAPAVAARRT